MIVEDNQPLVELIRSFFAIKNEIDVVDTASNSTEAIEKLKIHAVDVIILDLIMPRSDGFVLLEYLNTQKKRPEVLVLTALGREDIVRKAFSLGASYYMIKPFSMEILHERVIGIVTNGASILSSAESGGSRRNSDAKTIDYYLGAILSGYGISEQSKGYQYLFEAVKIVIANPEMINTITKQLYPEIGQKFNCSALAVERSIRRVIGDAWKETIQGDQIADCELPDPQHRPSNSEFISMISTKFLKQLSPRP